MNKSSNWRNRSTKALAVCCGAALLVSSFAYFTDRVTETSTATAGTMDLVFADNSVASGSNNEFAIDKVWDSAALVSDGNIINPGDYFDLSYTLTNDGSKSMDVRQQLVLTSSVALTDAAEEYALTITGGNDSTAIVPTKSDDDKTLTYSLKDIILNGSVETETGAVTGAYDVQLDFAKAAKNAFMNSSVTVDLDIQAKQHRNTTENEWVAWGSYTTDFEQVG